MYVWFVKKYDKLCYWIFDDFHNCKIYLLGEGWIIIAYTLKIINGYTTKPINDFVSLLKYISNYVQVKI